MGKRIWQAPGKKDKAEWLCLSDSDFHKNGGTWHNTEDGGWFIITIQPNWKEEGSAWYYYARWLTTNSNTLQEAYQRGYGFVIGSGTAPTASQARTKAKTLVETYKQKTDQEALCPIAREPPISLSYSDYKRKRISRQDPFSYLEGFLDGSRERANKKPLDSVYAEGWGHGRDYSAGRSSLPTWILTGKKDVKDG